MNQNSRLASPQVDEEDPRVQIPYALAVRQADEEIAQPAQLPLREPCSFVYFDSAGNSIVSGLTADRAAHSLNDTDIPSKLYVPHTVDEGDVEVLQDEYVVDHDAVMELVNEVIGTNIEEDDHAKSNMIVLYDPEAATNNPATPSIAKSPHQKSLKAPAGGGGEVPDATMTMIQWGGPASRDGILKNGKSTPRSNSSGKSLPQSNVAIVRSNSESNRPKDAAAAAAVNAGTRRPPSVQRQSSRAQAPKNEQAMVVVVKGEKKLDREPIKKLDPEPVIQNSHPPRRRCCRPVCYLPIGFFLAGMVCTLALVLVLNATGVKVLGYNIEIRTVPAQPTNQPVSNNGKTQKSTMPNSPQN